MLAAIERWTSGTRGAFGATALLFLVAFLLRLLFLTASVDATWTYSMLYEGDAELWQDYADARAAGHPFAAELGLPLRPPGMARVIVVLRGLGIVSPLAQKLAFAFLGALTVALVHRFLRRPLGEGCAMWAASLVAIAHGLLVLSASLNNETPYLLLAVLSIGWTTRLARRVRPLELAVFSALQGLVCLVRVEHVLFASLAVLWCVIHPARTQAAWGRFFRRVGELTLAAFCFFLVILPWQLEAREAVDQFEHAGEASPRRMLVWSDGAEARLRAMPVFVRSSAVAFLEAAVRHRGRRTVERQDVEIIREAYGALPEGLPRTFLIALYGPLNFHLANGPWSDGAFTLAGLSEPPPLVGRRQDYPPGTGQVPATLTLVYPPHLQALNHGYLLGLTWMLQNPFDALVLFAKKLNLTFAGATLGFGGDSLPLGASGWRRPVDLVVPKDSVLVLTWRLGWLGLVLLGIVVSFRRAVLAPWLLFLGARLLVAIAFFGYARQGALLVPVCALYAVLAFAWLLRRRTVPHPVAWAAIVLLVFLGLEGARWSRSPRYVVDGTPVVDVDPLGSGSSTGHGLHDVRVE